MTPIVANPQTCPDLIETQNALTEATFFVATVTRLLVLGVCLCPEVNVGLQDSSIRNIWEPPEEFRP